MTSTSIKTALSTAWATSGRIVGWVGVVQAATQLQCSTRTIRRRIEAGDIPHRRFGKGPYKIPKQWLDWEKGKAIRSVIRRATKNVTTGE